MVVAAICAMSAMAAASASAAPKFLFHGSGPLLASAGGTQTLTTAAGKVECTALKLAENPTVTLEAASVDVVVEYEKCKAFGLAASVSLVHYRIFANGTANLQTNATVTAGGGTCVVTVPSTKNQNLHTLKYHNTVGGPGVLVLVNVVGVTSSGAGSACPYAEESVGTEVGTLHLSYTGGVVRWDP